MASSLASTACIAPRGAVGFRARGRRGTRRPARAVAVRAATYDEVFDGVSGQMEKVLSQSVETLSAGGLDWSYRLGVPEDGVPSKPNTVVLVHGAGLLSYTYSKLMKELQSSGFVCPDTAPRQSLRLVHTNTTSRRTRRASASFSVNSP